MTKVNLEVIKPWITQRVTEILGFEDDVVVEFVFNQLDEKVTIMDPLPRPSHTRLFTTAFVENQTLFRTLERLQ